MIQGTPLPLKPEYNPSNCMLRRDMLDFQYLDQNYAILHPTVDIHGYRFPLLHAVGAMPKGVGTVHLDEQRAERLHELLLLPYPNILLLVAFKGAGSPKPNTRYFTLQYLIAKQDGVALAEPRAKAANGYYPVAVKRTDLIAPEIIDTIHKLRLLIGEGE